LYSLEYGQSFDIIPSSPRLTEGDDLLVIPVVKMIVQGIPAEPWTHLLRASSEKVRISPAALGGFAVCLANIVCEVERELQVTGFNVGGKMKLGNEKC
jgi:hypothetical protein